MRGLSVPETGDVVVRRDEREGKVVYVLQRPPGPDQYFVRTRAEAVAQAIVFAQLTCVRAWFTTGPNKFVLLAVYAPRAADRHVQYRVDVRPETA